MSESADLEQLGVVVQHLLAQPDTAVHIERLRAEAGRSTEPFVWTSLDLAPLGALVPAPIRSGWIFVLRRDTPSGAHLHPNSVQHMFVAEGQCRAEIGGAPAELRRGQWVVIPAMVAHEFFPSGGEMVVVSFHTCPADALKEVSAASGASRVY